MKILGYFFLFLHKNIRCGYSLEAPQRGASNEYHNTGFYHRVLLMDTHNICLYGELEEIILELSSNTPPQQLLCCTYHPMSRSAHYCILLKYVDMLTHYHT